MNDTTKSDVPVVAGTGNAAAPQNMASGLTVAGAASATSIAMANAAAAEALGMIMAAQAVPRDEVACLNKIQNACCRKSLAEVSEYQLARGGTDITGPTIHLLKAIAGYWRNIKSGVRFTKETATSTEGVAYAWDMEANHMEECPFCVKHVRYTRQGTFPLTNPDDIRFLVNATAARCERKALEAVIPIDVVSYARECCNATLKTDMKNFNPDSLLEAFAHFGVTKADIEAFSQRSMDALKNAPGVVARLRKILVSLRDGVATKEDFFKTENAETPKSTPKGGKTPSEGDDKGKGKADAGTPTAPSGGQRAKGAGKSDTVEEFLRRNAKSGHDAPAAADPAPSSELIPDDLPI